MADVCTKCISGNNIKVDELAVIKTGGGKSFQSTPSGTVNNNLHTQMDTKYDTKFDNSDFHTVTP